MEVTCELEVLVRSPGDATGKKADGADAVPDPGDGSGSNVTNETIKFQGTGRTDTSGRDKTWDLGDKNKLTGITWGGGTTGGENASITFSYRNFNTFIYSEAVTGA